MKSIIKLICEIFPLIAFFYSYKVYGLFNATLIVTALSLISLLVLYVNQKKFPIIPTISALVLVLTSLFTYYSGSNELIKYKPTIVNGIFSLALLHGILNNKGYLKYLLDSAINLSEEHWVLISKRWMFFFIFLGILNLFVLNTMPEETWVKFKAFGLIILTIIFMISQLPFLIKNAIKEAEQK